MIETVLMVLEVIVCIALIGAVLLQSGKGFFIQKEGAALALREELSEVAENPVFAKEIADVIQYRAMDYYQRRYRKNET